MQDENFKQITLKNRFYCYFNRIVFFFEIQCAKEIINFLLLLRPLSVFVTKFASSSKFSAKNIHGIVLFPEALPQAEINSGFQPEKFVF